MLVQVLQLTPEQMATLPPNERAAVEQLVRGNTFLFQPLVFPDHAIHRGEFSTQAMG